MHQHGPNIGMVPNNNIQQCMYARFFSLSQTKKYANLNGKKYTTLKN